MKVVSSRDSDAMLCRTFLLAVLLFGLVMAAGCGREANLVRDEPGSGLVSYGYDTDAQILSSPRRRDALDLIAEKCPKGSRIVREGELAKVSKEADRAWRGQLGMEHIWGIRFVCE
jgi:hypothetical protein